MRQILWGLFKKIVIADNCAVFVNNTFDSYPYQSGNILLIGAIFFAFQLYADFSGYSDMAIGIAKLLGLRVSPNFNYPFFAKNIADFWRRWHISLTSWFTDYVFTPLSFTFRKMKKGGIALAVIINFILVGLWHGANWTFVVFGLFQGILFIPLIFSGKLNDNSNIVAETKMFPNIKELFQMGIIFFLFVLGCILFRSETLGDAFEYMRRMIQMETLWAFYQICMQKVIWFIVTLLIVEWIQRNKQHGLEIAAMNPWLRRIIYCIILFCIVLFMGENEQNIYFKF
jgi:D-alanyl-lipoteichoic acid acyltransferase DltB (MBOAT superfamily)